MSALLHPVGPEEQGVYWMRRVVAVVGLVLVLALITWVVNLTLGRGQNAGPDPATAPSSSSPTATGSASNSAATSTTSASTGQSSTGQSSAGQSSSGSASAAPSSTASASASPSSPVAAPTTSAVKPTPTPTVKPTPKPTPTPTGPFACQLSDLTMSLAGAGTVTSGATTTFRATVVNNSARPCVLTFAQQPLVLTITSGTDQIWTNSACAAWMPQGQVTIGAKQAWVWPLTWGTKRSGGGCTETGDYLKPGTYVATATLGKGVPRRWVMRLVG